MRLDQSNKLKMSQATLGCLKDSKNTPLWQGITGVVEAVDDLETIVAGIVGSSQRQSARTGYAAQKAQSRQTMLDAAFTVCSGLKALASATHDTRLAAQADFSPSDLARGREADVVNRCQSVLALGNGNAAALAAKYHVTAADLTALQGAITAFGALQPMPRQGRAASAAATAELRNLFAKLDETLNNKLDPLLAKFRFTQPAFHEEYLTARTIVDSTGSRALKEAPAPAPLPKAA